MDDQVHHGIHAVLFKFGVADRVQPVPDRMPFSVFAHNLCQHGLFAAQRLARLGGLPDAMQFLATGLLHVVERAFYRSGVRIGIPFHLAGFFIRVGILRRGLPMLRNEARIVALRRGRVDLPHLHVKFVAVTVVKIVQEARTRCELEGCRA